MSGARSEVGRDIIAVAVGIGVALAVFILPFWDPLGDRISRWANQPPLQEPAYAIRLWVVVQVWCWASALIGGLACGLVARRRHLLLGLVSGLAVFLGFCAGWPEFRDDLRVLGLVPSSLFFAMVIGAPAASGLVGAVRRWRSYPLPPETRASRISRRAETD